MLDNTLKEKIKTLITAQPFDPMALKALLFEAEEALKNGEDRPRYQLGQQQSWPLLRDYYDYLSEILSHTKDCDTKTFLHILTIIQNFAESPHTRPEYFHQPAFQQAWREAKDGNFLTNLDKHFQQSIANNQRTFFVQCLRFIPEHKRDEFLLQRTLIPQKKHALLDAFLSEHADSKKFFTSKFQAGDTALQCALKTDPASARLILQATGFPMLLRSRPTY